MNFDYQELMFPALLILIGLFIFSIIRPTESLTYLNSKYLEKLEKCQPYTVTGKLHFMLGNKSSTSSIIGYKKGKCTVQTINTFMMGKPVASTCILNKEQLGELHKLRTSNTFIVYGFDDGLYVDKLKKEGVCKTYNLIDNKWVEKK